VAIAATAYYSHEALSSPKLASGRINLLRVC
jgi:hypothetical protein